MSGITNESLCKSLQVVELHGIRCKNVQSFPVIYIPENITTRARRENNISKTTVAVVGDLVKKTCLALRSPTLTSFFGYWHSEVEIFSQINIQHESVGSTRLFYSPCGKWFRRGCFQGNIQNFLIVIPFAVQYFLVLRDCSIEVVTNVRLVSTQNIRVVFLLTVVINHDDREN